METHPPFTRTLALSLVFLLSAIASAAPLNWGASGTGGSATWDADITANWFDGSSAAKWPAPGGTDDDAVFAGTAGQISVTTGGVTANDLTFNATGYTIQNETLTLNGTTPTITTAAAVTAEISSTIAGASGFTKTGLGSSGVLTLSGTNTFSGNVNLNSGVIRITQNNSFGTTAKTVNLNGGGSIAAGLALFLDPGESGGIILPSAISFSTASNSYAGIRNKSGTNRIQGTISLKTGLGSTAIASDAGTLTVSGNVTAASSGRTLLLTGASTAGNTISGIISNGSGLSLQKTDPGHWTLTRANTYSGTTTINSGKLIGVTGGSCANSAVTLAATAGNHAVLGFSITDATKQWTCASLTVNNAGTASDLDFNFGTLTPSTTLAPLKITGALDLTTTPAITVTADSNLGPIGTKFPLITWGSITGTLPTSLTLNTSNPTEFHLEVIANTLYLVIDNYTPTLSDTQLFSSLNLAYPGLETVKLHAQTGDFPAAKTALATYLRNRTNVNWYFNWRSPTTNITYNKSEADTTIAGTFSFAGYTTTFPNGEIDWLYTPSAGSQWVSLINRMNFWPNYGATYWGTADESYAQAWSSQLRSWITQCPAPSTTQSILSSWATIQAAERMRTWHNTFFRFIKSPSFTDEDVVIYLKSSIENTRHLRQFSGGPGILNTNIHAWELSGIYTTATAFPELSEAAEWRAHASQEMNAQQQLQFYPDGVHIELSPRYHIGTLNFVEDIYNLAKLNGRLADLPAGYIERTEKAYDFLLYNSAPNRLLPPFNDCGAANEDTRTYLQEGYEHFPNRSDFLWTSGSGTKPAKTSWKFPYAGYGVMRSGWESDANFLCFDAGPLGSSSHRHEDKLNVVLWAYGRELLFDSGGGSYESSTWRTWGTSSYSHNCITVDGLAQKGGDGSYQPTDADYQSQAPIDMRWESGANHDFAAGVYNRGYGGDYNNRPAAQTRRVLFVKPDIYLVADTMVPNNTTASRTYQARWHLLSPNTTLDPLTKTVTTTDAGKANLAVVPCLGTGLTVDNVSARLSNSGSTTPVLSEMLGWDQPNLSVGTQTPATTVTQTLSGTGTKHFLTLFLPLKSGQSNPVASVINPTATSAEVTLTDGRRLLVEADPDPTRGLKLTEFLPDNSTNRYVGAGNNPPVIAGLANLSASPSAVLTLPFTVTDNSPNVTVTVRSSNQVLAPDANLIPSGTGTNRTLGITLAPNKTGAATLIVTALDPDGSTTSEAIDITVAYPPFSPPVANPGNPITPTNTPLDIDLGTLASDGETTTPDLLFKVLNPANGTVTLLPDRRTARFTPAANFTGSAAFTYQVTDLSPDPRASLHYAFEAPDDLSSSKIIDLSANNRPGDIRTVGTGTAQLSNDIPPALASFGGQSILLTENGDNNGAQIRRTLTTTDLNLNDQNWTFACWFKRANTTNDDFILHLGSGNGFGAEEELQLWGRAGSNTLGLYHWNGVSGDMSIISGSVAPAGQWHHVALTYTRISANRGNIALFINGTAAGSATNIPFNFNQTNPVNLGGHAQTAAVSRWFNGNLDEAVILSAALSPQEIALLATQPVARLGGLTSSNTVTITVGNPLTAADTWRQTYFGTSNNTGSAADTFDADNDGETNLIEFATGQNPHAATRALTTITKYTGIFEFIYSRSKAAFDQGYSFTVEYTEDPAQPWTSFGPGTLVTDGSIQTLKAIIPESPSGKRFARLKLTAP